ncbi:hypothetical protein LguiA_003160 [Lonicera macranthoides]
MDKPVLKNFVETIFRKRLENIVETNQTVRRGLNRGQCHCSPLSMMRENKLYNASFRGDIRALEELLRQDKLALNHCGSSSGFCFNESPLHIAASRGHVDFAKVLLQHKLDLVNALDSRLRAPLHLASANG